MDIAGGDLKPNNSSELEELGITRGDLDNLQNPDASGLSGQVFFMEAKDDRKLAVKKGFNGDEGRRENSALELLAGREVLKRKVAPQLYYFDLEGKIMITEKIEGQTLDETENSDLRGMGETLAEVHKTRYPFFTNSLLEKGFGTQEEYLKTKARALEARAEELNELIAQRGEEFVQGINRIIEHFKELAEENGEFFQENEFVLIHNDLSFDNVIQSEQGPVIIDWGNSSIGDGALDIAKMFAKNNLSHEQQEVFFDSYLATVDDETLRQRVRIYYPMAKLNSLFTCLKRIQDGNIKPKKGQERLARDYGYLMSLIKE